MVQLDINNDFDRPLLPGYRLDTLELFNWGTFHKQVYKINPQGQTTLLVGENGSGKSTVVDALLTLLVRPQTRNYNVAAGARKKERDEKTYIRGAYDRTVGADGKAKLQYLRSGRGHFTAILACFTNQASGRAFTVCQILYMAADQSVEKVYAFATSRRSIIDDCANLKHTNAIGKHLRDRGFETTTSYKQYFNRIQKETGFRSKALDVFNQTVAVKDVQRLDSFIRQHMLESRPWKDQVARLTSHFNELNEAYKLLVRVRQQDELLTPIIEAGQRFRRHSEELVSLERQIGSLDAYFALKTKELLHPLCSQWQTEIEQKLVQMQQLDQLEQDKNHQAARLDIEIETQSGARLRELPRLIKQQGELAAEKKHTRAAFEEQLASAKIQFPITSPDQLVKALSAADEQRSRLETEKRRLKKKAETQQQHIAQLNSEIKQETEELTALRKRGSNLPESLIELRNSICEKLDLRPDTLPFAAELLSVVKDELAWEPTIEQAMYGMARSLLVPSDHYNDVARLIDHTRLVDQRGRGMRLTYLRVPKPAKASSPKAFTQPSKASRNTLAGKLEYRDDHPLIHWLAEEIREKLDYQACNTIEEFQKAGGAAMTANRHLKHRGGRHDKDDRQPTDRRNFVLGWQNESKQLALSDAIGRLKKKQKTAKAALDANTQEIDLLNKQLNALDQAVRVENFEQIDCDRHELERSKLLQEQVELENSDQTGQTLRELRRKLREESAGYRRDRDNCLTELTKLRSQLEAAQQTLSVTERTLVEATGEPSQTSASAFGQLTNEPLTLENLHALPLKTAEKLRKQIEQLRNRREPIQKELTNAMTRFLKRFPDEQVELDAHVDSLESFEALRKNLSHDELPKHEQRFKDRLNEKVLHEVGMLHSSLENERQEIKNKIEQLNSALKLLNWHEDSFMRLEISDSPDRELVAFRKDLKRCLSEALGQSPQSHELAFEKVESLVARFQDPASERWCQKVVDVRNWVDFSAQEIARHNGEVRSVYDGGAGKSGGEKGKLAFLILVAAIAYQYDLQPDAKQSNRFHFVMIDEMFSRSDDQHAQYALDLFERFGLQLLIVAPLDSKVRVTEPYVGTYVHVVKDKTSNCSELLSITAQNLTKLPKPPQAERVTEPDVSS